MPISTRGQLNLSTIEQIDGFQDCVASNSAGVTATVEPNPADSSRSVTQLKVPGTAASSSSYVIYEFPQDQSEVWIEFEIRYTHPASSSTGTLILLTLADSSDVSVVQLLRLTDSDTRWRAVNGSDGQFSTGIAKNSWEKIRLRYKAASGGNNGVLQAWRFSSGSYVSQVNITNNAATDTIRKLILNCYVTDSMASTTGDKIVWFRGLTWGTEQAHLGFKNRGLQFGHVCSTGSSSTTIGAMLFYRFPRAYHGTGLGQSVDPPDLAVQFQYKQSGESGWNDSGSPIDLEPDGQDEMTLTHKVTELAPLTSYDFRAQITADSGAFQITTEVITCTTPSAAGDDPGNLKYAFGSCAMSFPSFTSGNPKTVMSLIRDEGVHGFIHLGDMMYGTFEPGFDDDEPTLRAAYRKNLLWDFDQNRLHESAAFFPMWDDHEIGADNAYAHGPNPAPALDEANAAAAAYWADRRISAVAGAKGWWFDTAKCRFIMMDMRSEKDVTVNSESMLGSTQHNAVKAKLANTGKPINFLFSPGPVVIGHGTAAGVDGWNQPAFTPQRDELLQHFFDNNDHPPNPANSILIICSGDRHFAYVATDWGNDYDGRIKPEWCSSPLAFNKRNPAGLHKLGVDDPPASTVEYYELNEHGSVGTMINRYCLIEIDESNLIVEMSLIDATTQEVMYGPITYEASE